MWTREWREKKIKPSNGPWRGDRQGREGKIPPNHTDQPDSSIICYNAHSMLKGKKKIIN